MAFGFSCWPVLTAICGVWCTSLCTVSSLWIMDLSFSKYDSLCSLGAFASTWQISSNDSLFEAGSFFMLTIGLCTGSATWCDFCDDPCINNLLPGSCFIFCFMDCTCFSISILLSSFVRFCFCKCSSMTSRFLRFGEGSVVEVSSLLLCFGECSVVEVLRSCFSSLLRVFRVCGFSKTTCTVASSLLSSPELFITTVSPLLLKQLLSQSLCVFIHLLYDICFLFPISIRSRQTVQCFTVGRVECTDWVSDIILQVSCFLDLSLGLVFFGKFKEYTESIRRSIAIIWNNM